LFERAPGLMRITAVVGLIILASATLNPASCGSAAQVGEPAGARVVLFGRYLDALRVRAHIPGLSAAIVHQQRVIWESGFGFQDMERRMGARPDTPYRIASLTKTLSSALLMRCHDRRTVHLDFPINRYTTLIPELALRCATF
jgi:CubicO group peptidase (beta-lactamase class C family)